VKLSGQRGHRILVTPSRETKRNLPAREELGLRGYDHWEIPINVVNFSKPNVLAGLNQNGTRGGMIFEHWAIMDGPRRRSRKGPTRSEIHAEQGR
jgi:hypothetical protein